MQPLEDTLSTTSRRSMVLGEKLRAARLRHRWTLDTASQHSGVAKSTLSKIENGSMSPTFEVLQKLVSGLSLDLASLFNDGQDDLVTGRRSVTRKGGGVQIESGVYIHELLASDLTRKKFLPFKTTVTAHSIEEFGELVYHGGEEMLVVLSGTVELHTQHYSPTVLEVGDSAYFDSTMQHGLVSLSEEDAEVLWICSDETLFL